MSIYQTKIGYNSSLVEDPVIAQQKAGVERSIDERADKARRVAQSNDRRQTGLDRYDAYLQSAVEEALQERMAKRDDADATRVTAQKDALVERKLAIREGYAREAFYQIAHILDVTG